MSTITKEWLQSQISAIEAVGITDSNTLEAFKLALASLEAEAVAFVMADDLKDSSIISTPAYRDLGEAMERTVGDVVALYAAPPAPVSVPDAIEPTVESIKRILPTSNPDEYAACIGADMWNACRAAMLQGAENAESPTTMKTAPTLDSSPKIAESTSGKSPVIPDGWVMVPVEPTEDMIVNGFESEPDESFSDEKEWEEYDAMSGCQQAAHRAKLCWAAMIASAPKPEA
ncbi:hypothetical protein [Enterobacter asburiae]|uniref:hypothetical protein n=1 Tax=Enterobacter asburiae TaxID=61645 RepID=UPI001F30E67B|nr:hypothetical protein [Enterobacter asburiae]